MPLIAKDALLEQLPVADVEGSREVGRAAVQAMLAVAAASPVGAVLESNFYRSVAADNLRALPGEVIELFCRCRREVAEERYRQRSLTRNAGYPDQLRTSDELWNNEISEPVAGGWLVIEVDTNDQVDVPMVADQRH